MKINRRNFFAVLLAPFLKRPVARAGEVFLKAAPQMKFKPAEPSLHWNGWAGSYPGNNGNILSTYGGISRCGPVSPLLPVDENGEDALTRVTKNYMAAEEGLQKSLEQVHGKD